MRASKVLLIFLMIIISGCSMLVPFRAPTSCVDKNGNGVACASVEENLAYSESKDNPKKDEVIDISKLSKKERRAYLEKEALREKIVHSDSDVERDEVLRLLAGMNIDSVLTKRPVMIPPQGYRVLVLPYTDNNRYYSGRYIYITAGKARWVSNGYLVSGASPIKLSITKEETRPITDEVVDTSNIPFEITAQEQVAEVKKEVAVAETQVVDTKAKVYRHKVNTWMLNCRNEPSVSGSIIAVFEKGEILDVVDKSMDWWQISFFDKSCYVSSKYLHREMEP